MGILIALKVSDNSRVCSEFLRHGGHSSWLCLAVSKPNAQIEERGGGV